MPSRTIGEYSRIDEPVIYQNPLAYLLGLEGIALLRGFSGVYDRDFTIARLREIRALLDSVDELGAGVEARPISTREGYARWAAYYDEPGNQLLDLEQPVVREILDSLPVGVALDAACGTGRHTAYLASLGHKVIGVDTSPEMLARAREKVPEGEFYEADLHDVPLVDDSVDLVVCAIALSHVADLAQALGEFVRVLRPNGHLVISDSRGLIGDIGLPLVKTGPDGNFGYMPIWSRLASDYLAAALPLGLQVRRCEEPRRPSPLVADDGTDLYDGAQPPAHVRGNPPNIWALHRFCTAATNAAYRGNPAAIIWHFQLASRRRHVLRRLATEPRRRRDRQRALRHRRKTAPMNFVPVEGLMNAADPAASPNHDTRGVQVPGQIVHIEIPADDTTKGREFWGSLFNWQFEPAPGTGDYHMTRISEQSGAAISGMEAGKKGARAYFDVDDINVGAARVRELGGQADDPQPVPNMGWFATCTDPHGNEFGLWQTDPSAQPPTG